MTTDEKILKELQEMNKRFAGIDKRFDGIDKRFDGVDKRFDGVDKRFDGIDKRFDGIDNRLETLQADVTILKVGQAHTNTTIKVLATKGDVETAKEELRTELATKSDIQELRMYLVNVLKKRIELLEEHADIQNREKN